MFLLHAAVCMAGGVNVISTVNRCSYFCNCCTCMFCYDVACRIGGVKVLMAGVAVWSR
jgi:hypothetical protein